MNDPLIDTKTPKSKSHRLLAAVLVILLALPVLFVLFEYVLPRLLPANF